MANAEESAWHLESVQDMVAINIVLFEHWFLHPPSGDNPNFSLSDWPWGIPGIITQNDSLSGESFSVLSFIHMRKAGYLCPAFLFTPHCILARILEVF